MNCYQAKAGELAKHWYVIDAEGMVVGRLAAQIAPILMGKHRPTYTPHVDTGDYIIVTNVEIILRFFVQNNHSILTERVIDF